MATANPFDLLGDDDNDDPSVLIAAQQQKAAQQVAPSTKKAVAVAGQAPVKQANLPSKPVPPAQSVREAKTEAGRGGARGGRGYGRGAGGGGGGRGGGYNREQGSRENTFGGNDGISGGYRPSEDKDANARQPYRSPRQGGYNNGEAVEGERPRRQFERRSGTGRGSGIKRDGAGRGNWGTATEEIAPENEELVNENEKSAVTEKQVEEEAGDSIKENPVTETEEKQPEPEDKEMTLEEYEKVLEDKRKALLSQKSEERKVDVDKELKSMQLLSSKKTNDEIFAKLGVDKDKRKEAADKEEKAKKSLSINEFLKPAEGERYYNPSGGRGRGRGRGRGPPREGYNGGGGNANTRAPPIEDNAHFPSLGGK